MYERMLTKDLNPSIEDIKTYCGSTGDLLQEFNDFLTHNFKTKQEIRFPYGKEYGWGVTHRKGKKLMCDVFAEADAFTIMLRLSNEQFEEVYHAVRTATKHLIDHKYPCGGGGWIYYRVLNKEDLKDIETMLSIKCS